MLAIGMDVHSSRTTAYAVPLEESDLNMCAIAEDFNKSFRNFNSDRPGYAKPKFPTLSYIIPRVR